MTRSTASDARDPEEAVIGAVFSAADLNDETARRVLAKIADTGLASRDFARSEMGALFDLLVEEDAAGRALDCRSIAVALEAAAIDRMGTLAPWILAGAVTVADPDTITGRLLELSDGGTAPFSNAATFARRVAKRAQEARTAVWLASEPDLDEEMEGACAA